MQAFLERFGCLAESRSRTGVSWLQCHRKEAWEAVRHLGIPTSKMEEWRKTDVSKLTQVFFEPAAQNPIRKTEDDIFFEKGSSIVFLNGRFSPEISNLASMPQGVGVGSLLEALQTNGDGLQRMLGRTRERWGHAFSALNTACFEDGVLIHVPSGVRVEYPIYFLHISRPGSDPMVTFPRNLIHMGVGSRAQVVEVYQGDVGSYWTNAVTEVHVEANATLDHIKLEMEAPTAFHLASTDVVQGASSIYNSYSLSFGGGWVRNDLSTRLREKGSSCVLNGLYVLRGSQYVDHHTTIDHATSNSRSREFYKGILGDRSHGVFNGRVIVRPQAQKTDARQGNSNLLLSPDALIDSTPQLEIFADDVKCSHGATIGKLDENQLFYLRSRGLEDRSARRLLISAFAQEVLEGIRNEELQVLLGQRLERQLQL